MNGKLNQERHLLRTMALHVEAADDSTRSWWLEGTELFQGCLVSFQISQMQTNHILNSPEVNGSNSS
ncbi:hypothetical protein LIER_18793 [Lithospermum erythrorhizon]|uniref:Uncharacterized protein n=1 Tax=Lithospermum erythrorhizon TaxID=34254 RepID=A0AAV3QFA8_LITER